MQQIWNELVPLLSKDTSCRRIIETDVIVQRKMRRHLALIFEYTHGKRWEYFTQFGWNSRHVSYGEKWYSVTFSG